jgi:hypothetical protein
MMMADEQWPIVGGNRQCFVMMKMQRLLASEHCTNNSFTQRLTVLR